MRMMGGETWANIGSAAAGVMFFWAMFKQYFPHELRQPIEKYVRELVSLFYPYIHVTFHEYSSDGRFERSKLYIAIERYLAENSSNRAKRLKADVTYGSDALVFSMDDHEEVIDEFQNVKLWWSSSHTPPQRQTITVFPGEDEKRYYKLKFHKKNRELVTTTYLKHVLDEGKAIAVRTRQRKLYTNCKSEERSGRFRYQRMWSHVKFEHPSNFNTLAMDPIKKKEIINDLIKFSQSKDYYTQIGKAWKRGYLLYGPPGTGKSSMIAAMANLLEYDVYDLELTAVKDNTELRKLLIDMSSKSIVVIEDIDCSLDLTGQRKKKEEDKEKEKAKEKDPAKIMKPDDKDSKVTLSGLLNFIDGLWSASGGERIIIFTTNYVEKLDPALVRRGRMDKHVELSYCGFEAFKILAKNYMDLDSHSLFPTIEEKLKQVDMTPADVAENLMPKSEEDDAYSCLEGLVIALDKAKEDAIKLKAEKEAKQKKKEEEAEEVKKDGENAIAIGEEEVKQNGLASHD
ncbi:AAA-ATPase At3g28580-like [Impatiens glandulifera]|uniref:AAA-ATPase At3g28580-like n=1 Tax=Impatiens glandulifera TaxID=253017 RepID=UPI001FB176B1|nr:AAA-ATPase At3g28580-like [Impatiens glandulifera]